MVHFKDMDMFPKVHWWILEDSGRFLARIQGIGGQGGSFTPGRILEIYKSVIFRNQPILDNKEFLSLMCICCFITISELNLL